MSSSDVARSERVLTKIGAALGITPEGTEWLKAAVDPFHDTPLNVCGYPDVNEAASVTQVVRLSSQISVPTTVATDNNWDCHIHFFPWMVPVVGQIGVFDTNPFNQSNWGAFKVTNINGTTTTPLGGVTVCSVPAGMPTYDSGANPLSITNPFQLTLAPYLQGEYRIIGCGYEVINTTSELNIQGLVTVYRQPFADSDTAKSVSVYTPQEGGAPTVSTLGYPDLIFTDAAPQNPGTALLLDGSKQWKAKEGAYVVNTLNSDEIPAGIDMASVCVRPPTTDTNFGAGVGFVYGIAQRILMTIPPTSPTNSFYGWLGTGLLPTKFNQSGMYFNGLSYTTTLQLNTIWYIERFPSQQDSDLVVLAKHSCRSDSVARQLYSEITREMPVGVPQRMNGLGEWFADAVSEAANFVAPVLGAIPTPMTQGLSGIVKTAGNVAKSLGSKREASNPYSASGANTTATPKKVMAVANQPKKKKKATVVASKKKK